MRRNSTGRDILEMLLGSAAVKADLLPPLEESEAGRDILSLVESISLGKCKEFAVAKKLIGASNYAARTFTFGKVDKEGKAGWEPRLLDPSMPELFNGDTKELRSVMDSMSEALEPPGISAWISPISLEDATEFFIFIRHPGGVETSFIASTGRWHQGPPIAEITEMTLRSLLEITDDIRSQWVETLHEIYSGTKDDVKERVENILREHNLEMFSDEVWKKISMALMVNKELMSALQAATRHFGAPLIQSSQKSIEALINVIDEADRHYKTKAVQMEKDMQRSLTKMKSDLKKYKDVHEMSTKRNQILQRELAEARKISRSIDVKSGNGQASLAVALDELFS